MNEFTLSGSAAKHTNTVGSKQPLCHTPTVGRTRHGLLVQKNKVAERSKKISLEERGFEPLTFRLQSGRANHCATPPI